MSKGGGEGREREGEGGMERGGGERGSWGCGNGGMVAINGILCTDQISFNVWIIIRVRPYQMVVITTNDSALLIFHVTYHRYHQCISPTLLCYLYMYLELRVMIAYRGICGSNWLWRHKM